MTVTQTRWCLSARSKRAAGRVFCSYGCRSRYTRGTGARWCALLLQGLLLLQQLLLVFELELKLALCRRLARGSQSVFRGLHAAEQFSMVRSKRTA